MRGKESGLAPEKRDAHRAAWRGFLSWCVWYHVIFILFIISLLGIFVLRYSHSWGWIGLHLYAAPIVGAGIILMSLLVVTTLFVLFYRLIYPETF